MNLPMKSSLKIVSSTLLIGLILVGAIVGISRWFGSAVALQEKAVTGGAAVAQLPSTHLQQANLFQADTTLLGTVELKSGASGTYSSTWTAEQLNVLPNDVASTIDLAFLLKKGADTEVDGYIELQTSLVFTTQHTISTTRVSSIGSTITETVTTAVGPKVNGSLVGNQLTLLSERIAYQTESGQDVQRQFQLTADAANQGEVFRGEYRETVWGLTLEPLTILGTFELQDEKTPPTVTNKAPVANPQSVNTGSGVAKVIALTGSDAENNALTFTITSDPVNGTLSGTAPNLTYTPKANFVGRDSFTFMVNDGKVDSNAAAITINVTESAVPNTAPVANTQTVVTDQGQAKTISLTGSDADGDVLTFALVNQPENGEVTLAGSTATYRPNPEFVGNDRFSFKVNDGTVDSPRATVIINVMGEPAPPTPVTPGPVTPVPVTPTPDPSADDDQDGIPNKDEDLNNDGDLTNDDTDGDGTPNYQDDDDDGDGLPTKDEGTADVNGNGVPDYLEKEVTGSNGGIKVYLPLTQ